MQLMVTRTRVLPACSIVPQPTTIPRAPCASRKCNEVNEIYLGDLDTIILSVI
jgi:hypothetical protein